MTCRRSFCLLLASSVMTVRGVEGGRATIGVVLTAPFDRELRSNPMADPSAKAFVEALRDLGWIDGSNVRLAWRSVELSDERLPGVIRELAAMPVDLLVVSGNPGALAAKQHSSLRTVIAASYLPDEYGIVESLSKPGGLITGALLDPGRINTKRVALLKESIPNLKRIAYLSFRTFRQDVHDEMQEAARLQHVAVFPVEADAPGGFSHAYEEVVRQGTQALIVGNNGVFYRPKVQAELHALAIRHRLPVLHCLLAPGESGGLMAYAHDLRENYRVAARLVDRILRGAQPRDIPMEQATKLVFTVNLAAARAIGLVLPKSILLQADRVYE